MDLTNIPSGVARLTTLLLIKLKSLLFFLAVIYGARQRHKSISPGQLGHIMQSSLINGNKWGPKTKITQYLWATSCLNTNAELNFSVEFVEAHLTLKSVILTILLLNIVLYCIALYCVH